MLNIMVKTGVLKQWSTQQMIIQMPHDLRITIALKLVTAHTWRLKRKKYKLTDMTTTFVSTTIFSLIAVAILAFGLGYFYCHYKNFKP